MLGSAMLIELKEWARGQYHPVPSTRTLVRRADKGQLPVPVVKEGGRYYVQLSSWADEIVRNGAQS